MTIDVMGEYAAAFGLGQPTGGYYAIGKVLGNTALGGQFAHTLFYRLQGLFCHIGLSALVLAAYCPMSWPD